MSPRKTIAFAVLCLVWGSTWLAIRVLVEQVPPIRAAAFRFAIAVGVLVPILAAPAPAAAWTSAAGQYRP
jgi:drug/metabolite transporter (DMT)-like permease